MTKYVIIGNGIAGWTAAQTIREKDEEGDVKIISDENHPYYSRPGLMYPVLDDYPIKHLYLKSWYDYKINKFSFIHTRIKPGAIDAENRKIRLGKAEKISFGTPFSEKKETLAEGTEIEFDKLLLATGAAPGKGGWPGEDLKGVVNFTVIDHCRELYGLIADAKAAVVVGAGLIGIELVEILVQSKVKTYLLIRRKGFYQKGISLEQSELVHKRLEEHGVEIITEDQINRILPDDSGRVKGVVLQSGREIECQIVAPAIGVVPRKGLLEDTTIKCNKGIVVDENLRTNYDYIYAAGDCAEIVLSDRDKPLIELLWYTAEPQGRVAGANMAGENIAYEPDIFFNSASFMYMYYLGVGEQWASEGLNEIIVRNKYGIRRLIHENGSLKGYCGVGPDDMLEEVRTFVEKGADVHKVKKYFEKKKPARLRTGL